MHGIVEIYNKVLFSLIKLKKFAEIAKEHIKISGLSENHELLIGKTTQIIPTLDEKFDFIFIDHWKDLYLKDLKTLEENDLIKSNAWIFADNVILFNLEDYLDYVRSVSYTHLTLPTTSKV